MKKSDDFMNDVLEECQRITRGHPLPGIKRNYRIAHYGVQLVRDGSGHASEKTVNHPSVIARYFHSLIGNPPQEHLWVILLDRNNRMIGDSEISVGAD